MGLGTALNAVRRYWWMVLLLAVAVTAATWSFTVGTRDNSASATVMVTGTNISTPEDLARVQGVITAEFPGYLALASSPAVLERAVATAGVNISPDALNTATVATPSGQAIKFVVHMRDRSVSGALASGLAAATADAINGIHNQPGSVLIRAVVITTLPQTEVVSSTGRALATGAALGLVLGSLCAIGVYARWGRVGTARELASRTKRTVFGTFHSGDLVFVRRLFSVIEPRDGRLGAIAVGGATHDDTGNGLAATIAAFCDSAVSGSALVQLKPEASDSSENADIDELLRRPATEQVTTVFATAALARDINSFRLARRVDTVIIAVSPSERVTVVEELASALEFVGANVAGYVLTD